MKFLCLKGKVQHLIILILTILTSSVFAQEKIVKIGDPAPPFALKSLDGDYVYLRDFCGKLRPPIKNKIQQVVVVSFFATWCQSCLTEIKALDSTLANFKNKNIKLFLTDLKEEKSLVEKFSRENNLPEIILLDKYGVVAEKYGVTTLPRLFVIDQQGKLVWMTKGFQEDLGQQLTSVLEKLFAR